MQGVSPQRAQCSGAVCQTLAVLGYRLGQAGTSVDARSLRTVRTAVDAVHWLPVMELCMVECEDSVQERC